MKFAGPILPQLLVLLLTVSALVSCGGVGLQDHFLHLSILNSLSLPAGLQGSGIALQGSFAYVATGTTGSQSGARSLVIVSLEKPTAPTIVSATSSGLASDMGGIVVGGNYAYVPFQSATGTNFQVWNVSNSTNPTVAGSLSIQCPAGMFPFQNPVLYGTYVYVSCWESEVTATGTFVIVDVSNPASPAVVGSVAVTASYQPISLAVYEQNLYVAATQGGATSDFLLLYSIEKPNAPALMATESLPHSPQWVTAEGTRALMPIYDSTELQAIDFSSPTAPEVSSANLGACHPTRVSVYEDGLALVECDSPGGVAEVSVTATGQAAFLGTTLNGTVFNFLVASGNALYGVDASGHFLTIVE